MTYRIPYPVEGTEKNNRFRRNRNIPRNAVPIRPIPKTLGSGTALTEKPDEFSPEAAKRSSVVVIVANGELRGLGGDIGTGKSPRSIGATKGLI